MKMKHNKLLEPVTAAIFAAVIFTATALLPRIPLPGGLGYAHLGDAFILLCACLIRKRYSLTAAALGGAMADIATGYLYYAPFTLVAKACVAMCVSAKHEKCLTLSNALTSLISVPVTVVVYYIADSVLTGSLLTPLTAAPYNFAQGICSLAVFIPCSALFDSAGMKKIFRYG